MPTGDSVPGTASDTSGKRVDRAGPGAAGISRRNLERRVGVPTGTHHTMAVFGSASGSIWENWLRDHGSWISESRDPAECIGKLLWTPIGAASTAFAAYVDEFDRHPMGTAAKTAGVALSAVIPGAGVFAVAADATAVAAGHVIGSELNAADDRQSADQELRQANRQTLERQRDSRRELDALFG